MPLFKKVEKESNLIDLSNLKNLGNDPGLDGKVPIERLIIEEEISEPISLAELIEKTRKS